MWGDFLCTSRMSSNSCFLSDYLVFPGAFAKDLFIGLLKISRERGFFKKLKTFRESMTWGFKPKNPLWESRF